MTVKDHSGKVTTYNLRANYGILTMIPAHKNHKPKCLYFALEEDIKYELEKLKDPTGVLVRYHLKKVGAVDTATNIRVIHEQQNSTT